MNKKQGLYKILIEGTNLVGKTTLVQGIQDLFKKKDYSVKTNKNALVKNNFMDSAIEMANKMLIYPSDSQLDSAELEKIGGLFILSALIDRIYYEDDFDSKSDISFLIQDSYIQRSVAYHMAHNSKCMYNLYEQVLDKLIKFDINIYLETDLNSKKNRLKQRDIIDRDDREIIFQPQIIKNYDKWLEFLMEKESNYLKINTSNKTPHEVINMAVDYIIKKVEVI